MPLSCLDHQPGEQGVSLSRRLDIREEDTKISVLRQVYTEPARFLAHLFSVQIPRQQVTYFYLPIKYYCTVLGFFFFFAKEHFFKRPFLREAVYITSEQKQQSYLECGCWAVCKLHCISDSALKDSSEGTAQAICGPLAQCLVSSPAILALVKSST